MILAAAVCPHPPMIIPEVASGAVDDLAALRAACDAAVATLLARRPERVVVLGAGELAGDLDETAGGTFAAYGVDLHVGGPGSQLPLSLAVGAWLLDRAGWSGPRTYSTGVPDVDDAALLVMADGSAKRSTTAPGFFDDRAEAFDASIAAALASGDSEALAALDLELGVDLWAAGVPALRTLGELTKGADVAANLRVDVAPFGVGYWVADWVLS
ncbi:hypothetical protein [Aeromicrobium ginsengisoli]|uniref:Extradiol ring-cleavage dioxygenase class III enzyme subunit B domain-containing protein n=1 Tax=Aeromicrobium ginsengisoli TaxID=363867 RepID=A0A5M4FFT3_9ACTN|nr:hypothetical protein [Aeromicrobium ginsengisoli]KAA1398164.1 hypothetical protein ESP70_012630 [Aeromicrobium ginsengisoli]